MSDPAGWYPDPTSKHELRYWDGYAWADNVSNRGVAATDPLGGTPMPPPSEAAAKAQQGPPPAAPKSKTPLIIAIAAGVVVIAVVAFLLLRGDDSGTKVTQLGDKPATFADDVSDVVHPVVHTVHAKANTVVLVTVKSDDQDVEPGVVVLSKQATIDAVSNKIEGAGDLLKNSLKDVCSNLREEDIGATGDAVYFASSSAEAGKQLDTFMVVPVESDFEFVPLLVDKDGKCKAGKISTDLESKPLDFTDVKNVNDLSSAIADDPDLKDLIPG